MNNLGNILIGEKIKGVILFFKMIVILETLSIVILLKVKFPATSTLLDMDLVIKILTINVKIHL